MQMKPKIPTIPGGIHEFMWALEDKNIIYGAIVLPTVPIALDHP